MKRIINPNAYRPLIRATAFVALALGLQPGILPAAASTDSANAARLDSEVVRVASAVGAGGAALSTNLDSPSTFAVAAPNSGDTPETMMAAGREGLAAARQAAAAVNDVTDLTNRLSKDRAYAAKLLEAVKKNNPDAVKTVLKETMTRSEFTVHDIKSDFHLEFTIFTSASKTSGFRGCFSSDGSCDGHNITLG